MKKPKSPPSWNDLLKRIMLNKESIQKIFRSQPSLTYKQRYLHWHKLQYLTPPKKLSKEEWWASFKMARMSYYKELPFFDISKNHFRFTLPDPALEYLHFIDQNAGGYIEMIEKDVTNPKARDRYIVHSLIEEAITSSQLEGATSTRRKAKEMIRLNRKPRDQSEQMILNNYLTMQLIRERIDQPLSKDLIFELHTELTDQTIEDSTAIGRFRMKDEKISVYENATNDILHSPPHARELEKRFQTLCSFANGESPKFFIHPVIRAIILHFWLAYDHPFVDGNGRCARGLFYWSMLRQHYWLFEYISISQIINKGPAKYGRAFLYTENDDNDLTYFILYHLEVIVRAIKELHKYIAQRTTTIRKTEVSLRSSSINLNYRQLALLSHSLRHPDTTYSVKSHQNSNNIANQTARTDLYDLAKKGLLQKKLSGITVVFYPAPDLINRINLKK